MPETSPAFAFPYLQVGNGEIQIGALNSAVHLENLSGDVTGCRGGQEDHRGGDLAGIADPAQRGRLLHLPAQAVVGEHVHGGVGIDMDYPLHRYFAAAKSCEFTLGGATAQLRRIGAALASEG